MEAELDRTDVSPILVLTFERPGRQLGVGANRSPGGRPLWLFLEKATLKAGNRELVREGLLAS